MGIIAYLRRQVVSLLLLLWPWHSDLPSLDPRLYPCAAPGGSGKRRESGHTWLPAGLTWGVPFISRCSQGGQRERFQPPVAESLGKQGLPLGDHRCGLSWRRANDQGQEVP